MPSNKDRLYVALYARGGAPTMPGKEDTYHWTLIIGPKIKTQGKMGVQYHAKEKPKVGGGSRWLRGARLEADGTALGTSVIDWETVRNESMTYCQRKKVKPQHRTWSSARRS
ncbi:hypothetical protein BO78DRAFT_461497 [Aspergillus sclerotiicarbonarius CBS 121057]|uniref:Uncharacterized protein n=1 Tax=Aspergillus sclerotiicarbonarius (strain CBS 121057 / IBT 28362) TaxID=1448318 RepID=A0A319E9N0_ASPSB|nr:hypothetical protein BO78DRAFT_461497 [Aspergillus sclerotiicarbonarius CBS 121057]